MSPVRMDRLESGMKTVMAFINFFNGKDFHGLGTCLDESCRFEDHHSLPGNPAAAGRAAVQACFDRIFTREPEGTLEIVELTGMGMHCFVRWTYRWTERGRSEKRRNGIFLFRIKNGLIEEILEYVRMEAAEEK